MTLAGRGHGYFTWVCSDFATSLARDAAVVAHPESLEPSRLKGSAAESCFWVNRAGGPGLAEAVMDSSPEVCAVSASAHPESAAEANMGQASDAGGRGGPRHVLFSQDSRMENDK